MLSVYTRHHPNCRNAGDKIWRRCNCPKWIWGSVNGNFIRRSAKTCNWEEAEELRLRLLQAVTRPALPGPQAAEPSPPTTPLVLPPPAVLPHSIGETLPPATKRPRVSVQKAVEAYLTDAVGRNVSEATLDKLTTIFEKQFLPWTEAQGFEYIDEIEYRRPAQLPQLLDGWCAGQTEKTEPRHRLLLGLRAPPLSDRKPCARPFLRRSDNEQQ